jgi:hypothetical protein
MPASSEIGTHLPTILVSACCMVSAIFFSLPFRSMLDILEFGSLTSTTQREPKDKTIGS